MEAGYLEFQFDFAFRLLTAAQTVGTINDLLHCRARPEPKYPPEPPWGGQSRC